MRRRTSLTCTLDFGVHAAKMSAGFQVVAKPSQTHRRQQRFAGLQVLKNSTKSHYI
jgi:hypothetical protein